MNTLTLRDLDYISAYLLYVSLFYVSLSAYKRTKQKGFVFWGFAAIGYVLNSPIPFQPSRGYPASHGYSSTFNDVRHCAGVVNNILLLIGIVLIVNGFVEFFKARNATAANPPGSTGGNPESSGEENRTS